MQAALLASVSQVEKANLDALFDEAPALVAILRGREGVVQLCNAAFQQLWGKRKVRGKTMREAWPELEGQQYFEIIEQVYDTGRQRVGKEYPAKIDRNNNGVLEQAYFNFVYLPYYDEDGHTIGVMIYGVEITEQVHAKQLAQQTSERLSLALAASHMGLWEWDIKNDELTGSTELKEIFGLPANTKLSYKKYLSLIEESDRSQIEQIIKHTLKDGGSYQVEHRIIRPDGSVHWVQGQGKAFLEDGKAVRLIGTSMNIDDRKQAEMHLQESEARFRNMADSAPVLIWLAGLDKQCYYFNKPWLVFTGRSLRQEIGYGWTKSVHPEDVDRVINTFNTSFDAHRSFQMEYRLRRADGTYRWMLDNGTPQFSPSGAFLGYIGSLIDIHDFKRAVEQRKELEARTIALTQERSELVALNNIKDEFISLASHQLRTPATIVKQYLGMMLDGLSGPLGDDAQSMLHQAYESNERQIQIVNDLLKVAHLDAGQVRIQKESVDVKRLISTVVQEQTPTCAGRQQILKQTGPNRKLVVRLDPEKIHMVLENLIDNASKYSRAGKTITIETTADRYSLYIRVIDQGVGVAKRDLPKLFQKFSRINNELSTEVGGTGLGLYWVKKVIDLHGGTVTVNSTLHKGSIFTIILPRK